MVYGHGDDDRHDDHGDDERHDDHDDHDDHGVHHGVCHGDNDDVYLDGKEASHDDDNNPNIAVHDYNLPNMGLVGESGRVNEVLDLAKALPTMYSTVNVVVGSK